MWMPGGGGPPGIMLIAWSMPIPGGMGGMGIGGMGGIPDIWRGGKTQESSGRYEGGKRLVRLDY